MYLVTRPGPRLDLAAVYVEKYVHQVNFYSGSILLALLLHSGHLIYLSMSLCCAALKVYLIDMIMSTITSMFCSVQQS